MASPKRSWKLQEFVAHGANVKCLSLGHKSGRVLVTGGDDKKVNLWAVGKPNCIMSLTGHTMPVECVRFNPTEELVVAGSGAGAMKIWDLEAAKLVRTLTGHKAGLKSLDFHPYGDFLTSGSLDTSIKLWDIRCKGCIFTYKGHKQAVNSVKFSPDGQWIASGGDEGAVKLWDLRVGRVLTEFSDHCGSVTGVEFHPHEFLLASSSADRTVNFWDLENFSLVSTTERDNTYVRCLAFSPEGECLFGGSNDMLKVFVWEPARVLDSVNVGWSKVHDVACAQSQLIGATFHLMNVMLWVVDLNKVNMSPVNDVAVTSAQSTPTSSPAATPFAHGQSVRKSFSKQKPSPDAKTKISVKTIDEVERPDETDPEDDTQPIIPDVNDYRAVFHPNRSLNRSPPPSNPFVPPLSDDDVPKIAIVSPVVDSPPPKSFSPEKQFASMDLNERRSPPHRHEPTSLPPPHRPQRRLSTSTAPNRLSDSRDEMLSSPETEYPVKLTSAHQSPSEPSLSRVTPSHSRNNSSSNRSNFQPFGRHSMLPQPKADHNNSNQNNRSSLVQKLNISVQRERNVPNNINNSKNSVKEDKDDDFIPMTADRPTGLDLDDFLPMSYQRSLCYQQSFNEMSEAEVISSIMRDHESMIAVLKSRERSLQIVHSMWHSKDIKTAVDSAIAMNDQAVIVDLLGVITQRPGIWNLDLCGVLLPAIYNLLQSKFEMHITVGCEALRLILRNFSSVIKSNMMSASSTVGVDISKEERYKKCVRCYNSLVSIRAFLLKRQTVQGKLGHTFRELHILLQNLETN